MSSKENAEDILLDAEEDSENEEYEPTLEDVEEEEAAETLKLDYSIESPQERNILVQKIIDKTPPEKLTSKYLDILTKYLIFAMDKEERKQKKILTDNRMVTINKRETSYQGLAERLENGEDGIFNMMAGNNKNIIFTPKVSITPQDIEEIPGMKQLREAIEQVEKMEKQACGKRRFALKKQLIELRQDQYILKNSYRPFIYCFNLIKSINQIDLSEDIKINAETFEPESSGLVNFFNPKHIEALLCNYAKLKEDTYGKFQSDAYYMLIDLENLINRTLKEKYPLYFDLLVYKIDGKQNLEIQDLLYQKHGVRHSVEYLSSLWRKKIPKLIAEQAKEEYLLYHYTMNEKGKWKKCSRCGEVKLAHNRFFSKNKTSRDGFYSICKCCRNAKAKKKIKEVKYG